MMRTVLIILFGFALGSCTTTEQEYAKLTSGGTEYDLCYAAADQRHWLSGGPTPEKRQAVVQLINERGVKCDWALFAGVHAERERRETDLAVARIENRPTIEPIPTPTIGEIFKSPARVHCDSTGRTIGKTYSSSTICY